MVKYKSRINGRKPSSKVAKKVIKPKEKTNPMTTTGDEASRTQLFEKGGVLPSGGAVQTGGELQTGGTIKTGGAVQTGGVLRQNPARQSLGGIISDEDIDKMTHEDMGHALSDMDNQTFHIMQGVGGAFLNMRHPMAGVAKAHLGGAFVHPKSVARMATKDILKAVHPLQLANILHEESQDQKRGMDVGGGLLSSLKAIFKKGVSRGRELLKDPKAALTGATQIADQLSKAIRKGISIAKVLSPAIAAVGGPDIGRVIEAAERVKGAVEAGKGVAERIKPLFGGGSFGGALGGIDEPLVVDGDGMIGAPFIS